MMKDPKLRDKSRSMNIQQQYALPPLCHSEKSLTLFQGVDDTRTPTLQQHRKSSSKSNNEAGMNTSTNENTPKTNGNNNAKDSKVQDDNENTTVFEKVEGE